MKKLISRALTLQRTLVNRLYPMDYWSYGDAYSWRCAEKEDIEELRKHLKGTEKSKETGSWAYTNGLLLQWVLEKEKYEDEDEQRRPVSERVIRESIAGLVDHPVVTYENIAKMYQRSAEQGSKDGMFRLGWLYLEGTGLQQDHGKAIELWRQVANENTRTSARREAQYNLGFIYANGRGVPQDGHLAVEFFTKSLSETAQNDFKYKAMYNIGMLYGNGIGILRDHFEAYTWFTAAALIEKSTMSASIEKGERASKSRQKFARKLSPKQVKSAKEDARGLLREFLEFHTESQISSLE